MIQEVSDLYGLLSAVHTSIDAMLEGLTEEQLLAKPRQDFNNIASVIDHIARVEKRFFSVIAGAEEDVNSSEPFKAESWDLSAIRQRWAESLPYAERSLSALTEDNLSEHGLKVGIGSLNKRQLISYTIAHTTHHRGQIPLIRKLLG